MPSNPNHHRKRRDTLELEGDKKTADVERLKEHLPELFKSDFYLEQIQSELDQLSTFAFSAAIRKELTVEEQVQFDAYTTHLVGSALEGLRKQALEFTVQDESSQDEDDEFIQNHKITVGVGNVSDLLSASLVPIADLDLLRQLSSLFDHLRSLVDSREGKLPNFREHIKKINVEIETLKGELSDLAEQEKEMGLNRSEQTQKEQLEADLSDYHQEAAKNKKKLKRQQDRIAGLEQKISSINTILSDLLSEFGPHLDAERSMPRQDPQSISEKINLDGFSQGVDYELRAPDVYMAVKKILEVRRKGEYSSYDREGANQHRWMKRKEALAKWSRRLTLPLLVVGSVAYAGREQISEAIYGPQLNAEAFKDAGVRMPTDPKVIHTLLTHNKDLALAKVKILDAIGEHLADEQRRFLLTADEPRYLARVIARALASDIKLQNTSSSLVANLNPEITAALEEKLSGSFYQLAVFRNFDVETNERIDWLNPDDGKVIAGSADDYRIELSRRELCRDSAVFVVNVFLYLNKLLYRFHAEVQPPEKYSRKTCLESHDDPLEKAKQEAEYIRDGDLKYFDMNNFGHVNRDASKDPHILASLHVQSAKLELIKEALIERFKDVFTNKQIQAIKKAPLLPRLHTLLIEFIPYYSIETQEDGQLKIAISPDYVEAIKMVFGDDTEVQLRWLGDIFELIRENKHAYQEETTVSKEFLCRPFAHIGPAFRKLGANGKLREIYYLLNADDSIYQGCPPKDVELNEMDEFLDWKRKVYNHPLMKYMDREEILKLGTKKEIQDYVANELHQNPDFKGDFERIYKVHQKLGVLTDKEYRRAVSSLERSNKIQEESLQNEPRVKRRPRDYYFFGVPHDLMTALTSQFGKDVDAAFVGKKLYMEHGVQIFHVKKEDFCSNEFENLDLNFFLRFGTSIMDADVFKFNRKITEEDSESAFFYACMWGRTLSLAGKGFRVNDEQSEAKRISLSTHPLLINYVEDAERTALRTKASSMEFYRQLNTVALLLEKAKHRMVKDFEKIVNSTPIFNSDEVKLNPPFHPPFHENFKKAIEDQFGAKYSLSFGETSLTASTDGAIWKGEIHLTISSPIPRLITSFSLPIYSSFIFYGYSIPPATSTFEGEDNALLGIGWGDDSGSIPSNWTQVGPDFKVKVVPSEAHDPDLGVGGGE